MSLFYEGNHSCICMSGMLRVSSTSPRQDLILVSVSEHIWKCFPCHDPSFISTLTSNLTFEYLILHTALWTWTVPLWATHQMSPSILQLQTQAAHATQPMAINTSARGSHDSVRSLSSSSGSSSPRPSLDVVRCSRCQRSLSIDPASSALGPGVIRFGLNSYYCSRCAALVGFVKWSDAAKDTDMYTQPQNHWNTMSETKQAKLSDSDRNQAGCSLSFTLHHQRSTKDGSQVGEESISERSICFAKWA